jgi:hypothetical protein
MSIFSWLSDKTQTAILVEEARDKAQAKRDLEEQQTEAEHKHGQGPMGGHSAAELFGQSDIATQREDAALARGKRDSGGDDYFKPGLFAKEQAETDALKALEDVAHQRKKEQDAADIFSDTYVIDLRG